MNQGPTAERTDPYLRTLGPHIDALEIARAALRTEASAALTILRLAEVIERGSEQHGFVTIHQAARAVRQADMDVLGEATDTLLYTMLGARVHPERQQAVLIVDDDPVLTRLLVAILGKPGRVVRVAVTGVAILEELRGRRFDLVILDLGLPDLDGRMVLASFRKNPLTATLPVLVVSASSEEWVAAECMALGAAAYISKPFDPMALAAKVAELLALPKSEIRTQPMPAAAPAVVPVARPAAAPEKTEPAAPIEVLLAEHDPLTAQIIKHRLTREGLVVRHFASGTAALQAAQNLVPGLVILDAMTPGIEGIELLGRLRALPNYARIPILVLSDIGSEREVVRALGAGADDCIRKPFSPTELVARIERLLERR
jgi:DNA-binding response OmpR family regulator